jgi:3-oxoacyl-[acyl-carrier-protein] synthase-3
MEANGIEEGLLVTADPYSKICSPDDRDTAMLFGDAAAATLLTKRNPIWRLGRAVFGTDGDKADALEVRANRKLKMNGRGVFEFSATRVPGAILEALDRNAIGWKDVDRVILHQGSRYIVETIAKRINQIDKTPFGAALYGNAVSSSIPLMLESESRQRYRCILTAGFGVGLSWAVAPLFLLGER